MKRKKPIASGNQCITKFFKTSEIQSARTVSPIKKLPLTPAGSSRSNSFFSTPVQTSSKVKRAPVTCGTPDLLPTPRKGKFSYCDSPVTTSVDLTLDSSDSDLEITEVKINSNPENKLCDAFEVQNEGKVVSNQICVQSNSNTSCDLIDTLPSARKRIKLDQDIEVVGKGAAQDSVGGCSEDNRLSQESQASSGSQSWVKNVKITDVTSVKDFAPSSCLITVDDHNTGPIAVVVSEFIKTNKTEERTIALEDKSLESEFVSENTHEVWNEDFITDENQCAVNDTCNYSDALNSGEDTSETLPELLSEKGNSSAISTVVSHVKDADVNENIIGPDTESCDTDTNEMSYRGYGGWDDRSRHNNGDGYSQRGGFRGGRGYHQDGYNRGRGLVNDGQARGGYNRRSQNSDYWQSSQRGNHLCSRPNRNTNSQHYWETDSMDSRYSNISYNNQQGARSSKSFDSGQGSRFRHKSDNSWSRDNQASSGKDERRNRSYQRSASDSRQNILVHDGEEGHQGNIGWRNVKDSHKESNKGGEVHNQHRMEKPESKVDQHKKGDINQVTGEDERQDSEGRETSANATDQNKGQSDRKLEKKINEEQVETASDTNIASSEPTAEISPVKEAYNASIKVEPGPVSPVSKGISNLKKQFAGSSKASLLTSADGKGSKPGSPAEIAADVGSPARSSSSSSWLVLDECSGSARSSVTGTPIKTETSDNAEAVTVDLDMSSPKPSVKLEDSSSASPKSRALPHPEETSFERLLSSCGVDKNFTAITSEDTTTSAIGTITKAVESMKVEKSETIKEEDEDPLLLDSSSDESDDDLMQPSAIALVKSIEDACKPLPPVPEQDDPINIKVEPSLATTSRKPVSDSSSKFTWSLEKLLEEKREKESDKGREMSAMEAELKQSLKNGGIDCMEVEDSQETDRDFEPEQKLVLQKFLNLEAIQTCHPGEEVFRTNKCHKIFRFPGNMTLSSCGYSVGKSKIDKHLMRFDKNGKLLEFIKSDFIDMCFKNISSKDTFLTWVFYTMSVVDHMYTVEDLYKILYIVWTKKNSVNWVPSVKDIAKVFVNYGADLATLVPSTLKVDFMEGDLNSSEEKENEGGKDRTAIDNKTGYGRSNMLHVIKAVTLAIQKRSNCYSSKDLLTIFMIIARVAMDKSLTLGALKFDLGLCFSAILNAFSNEEWHEKAKELCGHLSTLTSHHHNKVQLVRLMLNSDTRGTFLQRRLAYSMLHLIFQTQEQRNITEMKVQMLHQFTIALCTNRVPDYYLLSSIITLLDHCVGKETLPSSEKAALNTLHEHIRHLMGSIRDTIHNMDCTKVKNMLVQVDAKWNFMLQGMGTKQATLFNWTNMVSTVSTQHVPQPEVEEIICSQSEDEDTQQESNKNASTDQMETS